MTEKQYKKADAMVVATLMVVMGGILLNMLGMINTRGADTKSWIVTIVSVLGILATALGYRMKKGTRTCGIFMSVVATAVWTVMVLLVDAQYFFMLVVPIFIAQMAYLEKARLITTAVVVLPLYVIRSFILIGAGNVSPSEGGTSIILQILIFVAVYNIAKIWIVFNSENLDTAGRVSGELVTHFDEANGYIAELAEALNKSNLVMQDITSNIEATAAEIQNQSQRCLDIENSTRSAKVQSDTMVEASGKVLGEVASGVEVVDKLHCQAQDVERDNKKTIADVAELNQRTKNVQNILGTIVDISTKTHLLALNAMVEAARAGEAGKGFAVVADEIKILAEQTKKATEDIEVILTELNKDVDSVTESINHSVQITEVQNQLIEKSRGNFAAIDDGVNELMVMMQSFKRVMDSITDASFVISSGITELSANSEEVAAAANDGTCMTNQAVEDMNQVRAALENIYDIAQALRDEYNVK
ncbi:MAG: hypothetical protein J6J42_01895 [Lachnospiraceae bacterium]|nr:hypothetical protein [Lachnospiraceae bacterium]